MGFNNFLGQFYFKGILSEELIEVKIEKGDGFLHQCSTLKVAQKEKKYTFINSEVAY